MTFYKYLRSIGFSKGDAKRMLTIRDQWIKELKRSR